MGSAHEKKPGFLIQGPECEHGYRKKAALDERFGQGP